VQGKGRLPLPLHSPCRIPCFWARASHTTADYQNARWGAARSRSYTSAHRRPTNPQARPTELHSKTHLPSSTENDHVAAHCAPASTRDIPVPERARGTFALTVHRLPLACASAVLRAGAAHCIPDENDPTPVAGCAGWLPAAEPFPVSACDAGAPFAVFIPKNKPPVRR
jgi:hypothetical protein